MQLSRTNDKNKYKYSNYRGICLSPTTHKILYNILPSRLTAYTEEITEEHQCEFRRNRSTSVPKFCVHYITEKKGSTMGQYISYLHILRNCMTLRREVLYIILIECWIPVKTVTLLKTKSFYVNIWLTSSSEWSDEWFDFQQCLRTVVFDLFPPVPLETLFHSTLYPQSCWCLIQFINN
jgi:hypothetical protein